MDVTLNNDLKALNNLLQEALDEGLLYLNDIDNLPTSVSVKDTEGTGLPMVGQGGASTLAEFKKRYSDLMVSSTGPRYFGFVTGGATPAALMGDILATIYDQNTQTTKGHGDVSAIVEFEAIHMLLDFFGLPKEEYLGGFVTGATMSNFTCLGVARQWLGKEKGIDVAKNGVSGDFKILSAVPHSSSIKALSMLGLGSSNIIKIDTVDPLREAIDIDKLEKEIMALEGTPFILISSGGTVNTVDFDDMQAIANLRKKYNFWWHVDAAFGGFAALSPGYAHLLKGWEDADSITIDAHKWLNVPYENAFFFVREEHKMLQVETFQNSNAPYLGDPMENFNYLNFLPENSRRFRALPAWFTLKAYGKQGYREIVERNIRLARQLGDFIVNSEFFELLAPVRLNTVCFTLKDGLDPHRTQAFLDALNDRGKVFMTPTVYNGRKGVRAALVNWRTSEMDIRIVEDEMLIAVNKIATVWF
ncbi:pyridoxal-dependent decarboxylase [Fulvivirga kasyanovii]|uniref:Aspartate aminotransferase family protein n=1 Tax=Fulvivirga kasyanovii TaxID=396812 RepID=A0ABW9RVU5_9BACT|nr:pyridoxal-dependent decarboxylase [Fulvivirga kasyanovii]MTI28186.1 aspartate aminotransferase family protein [Fulvivirga kasyanovii]